MGTIIVPTGMLGVAGDLWAVWDEASEDTLSVDQDGDGTEDTFICFMENPVAGGSEVGRGLGLSGENLILTQGGTVPGATGTPPRRAFSDTADYMRSTYSLFKEAFVAGGSWIACCNVTTPGYYFYSYADDLGSDITTALYNDGSKLKFYYRNNRGTTWSMTTTNNITTGSKIYIAYFKDNSGDTYIGFTTTKPTKWSDFDSNNRAVNTTNNSAPSPYSVPFILGRNVDAAIWDVYYVVVSTANLIDPTS